jgi:hypothetical protein
MKSARSLCFVLAGVGLSLNLNVLAAEDGWIDLFNGRDLAGWSQHTGKAKYAVEDGCILGSTVLGTGNSFLCTDKSFGDFVLELDFKVDPLLNSGVQIRGECARQAATLSGKDGQQLKAANGNPIKVGADRVYGYQCEIDMDAARKRLWTAGIYDEGRRGWLYPRDGEKGAQGKAFSEQGAKVSKPGEWNHLRIEAIGPHIKTWLNGEARAEITDDLTPRGFIALQVHGVGNDAAKEGLQARFRNLRIKEVASGKAAGGAATTDAEPNTLTAREQSGGWRLLWDGKTTDGWRSIRSDAFPAKGWEMADGALTVIGNSAGEPAGGGGDIITKDKFTSFELKVDFKITKGANSGIKYFIDPEVNKGASASIGLEYQVLDDAEHPDAKAGRNGNRTLASLYDLLPAAATKKVNPVGEWNTARIVVNGKHVEHWLNGAKVLETDLDSKAFREAVALSKFKNVRQFGELPGGHILLQDHGNRVSFRNIKVRKFTVVPR